MTAAALGLRIREERQRLGLNQEAMAAAGGVTRNSQLAYEAGRTSPSADYLLSIGEHGVDIAYVLSGNRIKPSQPVIDAEDAEWVEVGEHSLLEIDENGKMALFATTMVRKDWLYSSLGESSDLWITRLLTPYDPLQLSKGTIIICKDVRPGERMLNGVYYLFRINEGIVMAPFALRDPGGDETTITPRDIGHDEDQYQPVARVVGQLARPL